jgi:hypothetical protein
MRSILILAVVLSAAGCTSFNEKMWDTPAYLDMSYMNVNYAVADQAPPRTAAPAMDESRKVNEQDCSKTVVLDQGNLRCQ